MKRILRGLLLALLIAAGVLPAAAQGSQPLPITPENAAQVELLAQAQIAGDTVNRLAWAPDGVTLAVGTAQAVLLYDLSNTSAEPRELTQTMVQALAFGPDSRLLAVAGATSVGVWDAAAGTQTLSIDSPALMEFSLALSPDGTLLASAGDDQHVRLWDTSSGAARGAFEIDSPSVQSVAFSPDGTRLAAAGGSAVRVWEMASGETVLELEAAADCVAFSPDGTLLAAGTYDGAVLLWDAATGDLRATLHNSVTPNLIASIAFSPDGRLLAATNTDYSIELWGVTAGESAAVLRGHTSYVNSVAFSPDGTLLASGGADGTLRLWGALGTPAGPQKGTGQQ